MTRSEIDLETIKQQYKGAYGRSLADDVKVSTLKPVSKYSAVYFVQALHKELYLSMLVLDQLVKERVFYVCIVLYSSFESE